MEEEVRSLKSDVEELRYALATVSEALILFQEFLEVEIGEMAYFRDSGSYYNLVDILNAMRMKTMKFAKTATPNQTMRTDFKPLIPIMSKEQSDEELRRQKRIAEELQVQEDEEVEVEIDQNDDDAEGGGHNGIMINQVFSVSQTAPVETRSIMGKTVASITQEEKDVIETLTSKFAIPTKPAVPPVASLSNTQQEAAQVPLVTFQATLPEQNHISHRITFEQKPPTPAPIQPSLPIPPIVTGTGTKENLRKIPDLQLISTLKNGKKRGKGKHKKKHSNSKKYKEKVMTKTGLRVRRPSERPVKCPDCNRCYSSRGVMSRHIKETHQAEPQFPCFYCPVKFRNGPQRLEHMNTVHPQDMDSLICPYCQRTAATVAGKRNHMMLCQRKHGTYAADFPPDELPILPQPQ